jgi:uncharacterized protein YjdB
MSINKRLSINTLSFLVTIFVTLFFCGLAHAQCSVSSAPTYTSSCSFDYFTLLSASGTGITSTIAVSGSSCTSDYFNDYSTQGIIAPTGGTVNMTINRNLSSYAGYVSVYIDWNNNGTYETTELAGSMVSYAVAISSHTYSFTVPTTGLVTGTHLHMRVMLSELTTGAPCTANFGETIDFFFQANCSTTPTIGTTPSSGSICSGGSGLSVTASGAGTGGTYTWASSSGLSATTGSTVTATPTSTTVYTVTGTTSIGCKSTATTIVSVNPAPSAITGTLHVCPGAMTTLGDVTTGGVWSSGSTNATAGSATGNITGVTSGTAPISYTVAGCSTVATITIDPVPSAITGTLNVCVGTTTTLGDATSGGSWSSSNTNVSIGTGSGLVTGLTSGTSIITYTSAAGCTITAIVTVNILPSSITGALNVCVGGTTSLSDVSTGGIWSSSNTNATAGSATGIISGVSAGTSVITYTIGTGCYATALVTINALPSTIVGISDVCLGSTTTLSDFSSGGTWSSSNSNVTIGSSSGVVTGAATGTSTITYTSTTTGCYRTTTEIVDPLPASITGTLNVCVGSATTLSDASVSGTWSSSNSNATVGSSTGILTGVVAGTSVITYTLPTGCNVAVIITINPLPSSIAGVTDICIGDSSTLSDAGTGTWSSSSTNATVGGTTGIVTGVTAGSSVITYSLGTGCYATTTIVVNSLPSSISGSVNVCVGSSVTLSDGSSGGTWSGSNTDATVGSSTGVVSGSTAGILVVTYTLATGCIATTSITVNPLPVSISGTTNLCVGSATTLSDAGGGSWSSSNTNTSIGSSSGIATGVTSGASIITYTLPTGCTALFPITVNPLPSAITGSTHVCVGSSVTLGDVSSGGTWSSSNSHASIGSSTGSVTGISSGNSTITYQLATGCISTAAITVNALPAVITGSTSVCIGSAITLSDLSSGGAWSSSSSTVSVGSSTGSVFGISSGTALVTYTTVAGCAATYTVTVNLLPLPISGILHVCEGSSVTLGETSTGGYWSGSNANVFVGSTTGIVTGVTAGTSTISYTFGTGCYSTAVVTINPLPALITGASEVCVGSATTLIDTYTGGLWSISNTNAGIGSVSGSVTGITAGSSVVTYTLGTGCYVTTPLTIDPLPTGIIGAGTVCVGSSIILSDLATGGSWSSSNSNVSIGSSTGIATGAASGASVIAYTLGTGCTITSILTVNPLPSTITGTMNVCAGSNTSVADVTVGGVWSSSNTDITIGSVSGSVSGISAGTSVVTYMLATGCYNTAVVTVNPLPSVIVGSTFVCVGSTSVLSDTATGGIWRSGGTSITIDSLLGTITGVVAGTSVVTYTLGTGCAATSVVTVNAIPGAIAGALTICTGTTSVLSDAGGGVWSSSNANVSIGSSTGIATGILAGTSVITYTLGSGCTVSAVVTVNIMPLAITGASSVCVGSSTSLSDLTIGGIWSSSNANASAGSSSGNVAGISAGTSIISYSLGTGCFVTTTVSVMSLPSVIGGSSSVCVGSSATLTNSSAGGVWTSNNTNTTIGSASGIVSGISFGTSVITYTLPAGCYITTVITVNSLPLSIIGAAGFCAGSTTTLSDLSTGGVWSSSGAVVIGSVTGVTSGASAGAGIVTYTLPTGCMAISGITINALPAVIAGITSTCVGSSITLTDAGGGTWSSSNSSFAAIGSLTGTVTGVSSGSATITYTLPSGCFTTIAISVNPLPLSISGVGSICSGATTTFSELSSGGTWSSSDNTIATIGSSAGNITGVAGGNVLISYTLPTGCTVSKLLTVNALPPTIGGATSLCIGNTATLTDISTGGIWSVTGHATVGSSSGVVTGVSSGTSVVTYTLPTGCIAITTVTVVSLPSPITGPLSLCTGNSVTLADAGGGAWSSSNTNVSIGSLSGVVLGLTSGTSVITYTLGTGCTVTTIVTVNALPGVITGVLDLCTGSASALGNTVSGGNWSSDNHAVAIIGSTTGILTAVAAGSANITYILPVGCFVTTVVTVNPLPITIAGPSSVCQGSGITLTDVGSGTWSSSGPSIAAIGSSTGIVSGIAAGSVAISYTSGLACATYKTITVNPLPAAISGFAEICLGSSSAFTDTLPGGRWSSSSVSVATVGSASGIVSGATVGSAAITYTLATGCFVSKPVTIDPLPSTITGALTVCQGSTTTLSDLPLGGMWSASGSIASVGSATGVVTGLVAGIATITYTVASGCIATARVTVNPVPATISGTPDICLGSSTLVTDTSPGGLWSSSSTSIASIGSSGAVAALRTGTATITYTIPTGCFVTKTITVNPLPPAISGSGNVCPGAELLLADSALGGTWMSHSTGIAIGSATGIVVGIATGIGSVTYTLPTGCVAVTTVTVTSLPALPTGPDSVCTGATAAWTDTAAGGPWTSGSPLIATVGAGTGIITGISSGTAIISYTVRSTGCIAIRPVIIDPVSPVFGDTAVCAGYTITLYDSTFGGSWSSALPGIARVSPGGVVTGVAAGISAITYTLPTGCLAIFPVTVDPIPPVIAGPSHLCVGQSATYSDATTGGVWNSSAPSVAIINPISGVVTAISAGVATISYSVLGCPMVFVLTVDPLPLAITGTSQVCVGNTTALSDVSGGGSWSMSTTAIGSIATVSGLFAGISPGTALVVYTLPTGCTTEMVITVNPLPSTIIGPGNVCTGSSIIVTDAVTGGSWYSSTPSVAAIDGYGSVTGVSRGTTTITYTLGSGCFVTKPLTVNALPPAITGSSQVCAGSIITLEDSISGGTWSNTGSSAVATVGSATGIVAGITAGIISVTYTLAGTGCAISTIITVDPLPSAISGPANICAGFTGAFTDPSSGGHWSSSVSAIAAIDSVTGVATAVSAGAALITYTLTTGCRTTSLLSVNPIPSPISGSVDICLGSTSIFTDTVHGGIWESTDPFIVRVDSFSGAATGVATGYATVIYTFGGGCTAMLVIDVHPLPQIYNITGGGGYCAGGTGVHIGLDLSDVGYNYLLYHGATAVGTFHGSGSAIDFGLQTIAGAYHAVAINTITSCRQAMAGLATVVITLSVLPAVSIVPTADTVCTGTSVSFAASPINGGTSPVYAWSVNGIGVGAGNTYTFIPANGDVVMVAMHSNINCPAPAVVNSDSIALTVTPYTYPSVHIVAIPGDTVCKGNAITLNAVTGYGGHAPTYYWMVNGRPVASGTGAAAASYTYVPGNNDAAYVLMTSDYACRLSDRDSAHLAITVDTAVMPVVTIIASPGTVVLPGQAATFTATAPGAVNPSYQWYKNGYPIASATSDVYTSSSFSTQREDSLTCVVTSNGICKVTSFAWVYVSVNSVGVQQVSLSNGDINVMPNPNTGVFTIKGSIQSVDDQMTVEIRDMLGRIVYKGEITPKNGAVSASITLSNEVNNGMYILTLRSGTVNKVVHLVVER